VLLDQGLGLLPRLVVLLGVLLKISGMKRFEGDTAAL
jgi:hypothetical protein